MYNFMIILSGLLQVSAFSSTGDNQTLKKENLVQLRWTVLQTGKLCGIEEPENVLIKSKNDFDSLWNKIKTDRPDRPEQPQVSFESNWVIACFLGAVNTAGYSIELTSVSKETGKTIINLTYKKPGADCMVAQVIESPYLLVSIDHFNPVNTEFRVKIIESKCD